MYYNTLDVSCDCEEVKRRFIGWSISPDENELSAFYHYSSNPPTLPLLARKPFSQVVKLALRILQAVVHFLHMLSSIASHAIDN